MARWKYTEVLYDHSNASWENIGPGASGDVRKTNLRHWLSDICTQMGEESWEYVTHFKEGETGKKYRLFFRRPSG